MSLRLFQKKKAKQNSNAVKAIKSKTDNTHIFLPLRNTLIEKTPLITSPSFPSGSLSGNQSKSELIPKQYRSFIFYINGIIL